MNANAWNQKMQRAITEVQTRIKAVYPEATFRVTQEEEPPGMYIDTYTEADDALCVLNLVSDWLVDLSVNEGLHLHVIPLPKEPTAITQT